MKLRDYQEAIDMVWRFTRRWRRNRSVYVCVCVCVCVCVWMGVCHFLHNIALFKFFVVSVGSCALFLSTREVSEC